jgi:hypothetical protein
MDVAPQIDSSSVLRSSSALSFPRASIDGRLTDEDAEEHHGHHLARLAQDLRRRGRVTFTDANVQLGGLLIRKILNTSGGAVP